MIEFFVVLAVYVAAFVLVGAIAYGAMVCAVVAQAVAKAAYESRHDLQAKVVAFSECFGSWTRSISSGFAGDRAAKTAGKRLSHYSYNGISLAARRRKLGRAVTEACILNRRLQKAAEEEEDAMDALQDKLESARRNRPEFGWSDSPWHGRRSHGWKEHRSSQYR